MLNFLTPAATTSESCPVVVVGGSVSGLGVARSLAPAQTSVVVIDTSRFNAALWSRHCSGHTVADASGEKLIDELIALSRRFAQRPVLILTQDAAVEAVSQWRTRLNPHFRFLLPSEEAVDLLNDKGKFHDFAMQERLPVPRGILVTAADGIAEIDSLGAPMVVKPTRKSALLGTGLERAMRFDNIDEAKAHCASILSMNGNAIVQEWIDGPDDGIYFCLFYCDSAGQPLRIFTGRKLWRFPRVSGRPRPASPPLTCMMRSQRLQSGSRPARAFPAWADLNSSVTRTPAHSSSSNRRWDASTGRRRSRRCRGSTFQWPPSCTQPVSRFHLPETMRHRLRGARRSSIPRRSIYGRLELT